MEHPTPAVRTILRQVMNPRFQFPTGVIARLIGAGATDRRVRACAISVQAQCYYVQAALRVKGRLQAAGLTDNGESAAPDVGAIAEHVCAFSLAGIREARAGNAPRSGSRAPRPRAGVPSTAPGKHR